MVVVMVLTVPINVDIKYSSGIMVAVLLDATGNLNCNNKAKFILEFGLYSLYNISLKKIIMSIRKIKRSIRLSKFRTFDYYLSNFSGTVRAKPIVLYAMYRSKA